LFLPLVTANLPLPAEHINWDGQVPASPE
jgi:hypothetical protein